MAPKFYVISTKGPDCLKKFYETGWFDSLYTRQPDSRSVIESNKEDYSNFQFVFFDRVRKIDNRPNEHYRYLTGLYRLREVKFNSKISNETGSKEYSLFLERLQEFEPVPFKPGTPLWERIPTTRGKKLSNFYNARRILLPLTKDEFNEVKNHVE